MLSDEIGYKSPSERAVSISRSGLNVKTDMPSLHRAKTLSTMADIMHKR